MNEFDAFAQFYDADYAAYDEDLSLYQGFIGRTGGPVLELACGTGRLTLPIARQGVDIVGIDISPAMIRLARQKAQRAGLAEHAHFQVADMRDLQLDGPFALAFVPFNSFMHLISQEDQLAALASIHRQLRPGGLLIIDQSNPDMPFLLEADGRLLLEKQWITQEGNRILKYVSRTLRLADQIQDVTFIYEEIFPTGESKRHVLSFAARFFFAPEGRLLLEKNQFAVEAIYGSYELDPYGDDCERLIFVARKKA